MSYRNELLETPEIPWKVMASIRPGAGDDIADSGPRPIDPVLRTGRDCCTRQVRRKVLEVINIISRH